MADLTFLQKGAAKIRALLYPAELKAEISAAGDLGYDLSFLRAAQVLYDESWASCGATPQCGCTSVSDETGFGRNLDWGYPDNAADLVTRLTVINEDGEEFLAEGFAGLFGWLAITGEGKAASLNQAPCLRPITRTATPALWWFRSLLDAELPRLGCRQLAAGPSADVLLHVQIGKDRYLAETFDHQLMVGQLTGKAVQANTYQLWDLQAGDEWEADSQDRMRRAKRGRTIRSSLSATKVKGWTVDQFVMR